MTEQAKKKRNAKAKVTRDAVTGTITFNFGDEGTLTVNAGDFPTAIMEQAALAGLTYKISSSYNSAEGEYRKAAEAAIEMLKQGEWNSVRTGQPTYSYTARALAQVVGVSVEVAADRLHGMTAVEQRKIAADPRVKVVSSTMQAEDAKARGKAAKREKEPSLNLGALFDLAAE